MNDDNDRTTAESFVAAFAHLITGRSDQKAKFVKHVNMMVLKKEPNTLDLLNLLSDMRNDGRPLIWLCPHHEEEHNHRIGISARVDGVLYSLEYLEIWVQPDGKRTWLLPNPMDGVGGFIFDGDLALQRSYPAPITDLNIFEPEIKKSRERLSELGKLYSS